MEMAESIRSTQEENLRKATLESAVKPDEDLIFNDLFNELDVDLFSFLN